MRIRTIKPEFWSHPVMARMPDRVQLLALSLLSMADDHGYLHADPAIVRGAVAPFRESLASLSEDLARLSEAGWIDLWEHPEQGKMGQVRKWSTHQKIDHPSASKLAAYDIRESLARSSRGTRAGSGIRDQGSRIKDQGAPQASPATVVAEDESASFENLNLSDKKFRPGAGEPDDALFESFWQGYGKRVGKKNAITSWRRLSTSDRQAAIDGIPELIRARPDPQFRKNAQGYLTQRLWENEYPADSGQIPWGLPAAKPTPDFSHLPLDVE